MESNYYDFERKLRIERAKAVFLKAIGISEEQKVDEALRCFYKIANKIEIKNIFNYYNQNIIEDGYIRANNTKFKCQMTGIIKKERISGLYAFMITCGESEIKTDSILELLYNDISLNAFIDSERELIREKLEDSGKVISEAFGPGFYGIGIEEIKNFFEIMEYEKIGVRLKESGVIEPSKSCVGFFLEGVTLPKGDCKNCIGNKKGCAFCNNK